MNNKDHDLDVGLEGVMVLIGDKSKAQLFRLFRNWNPNWQLKDKVNLDDLKQWLTEEQVGKATLAGGAINTEYQ